MKLKTLARPSPSGSSKGFVTTHAILLAAGKSARFKSDKMGLLLNGDHPYKVLMRRLKGLVDDVTVVGVDCEGGPTRRDSLINGLEEVTEDRVLVVDCARVLVSKTDFYTLLSQPGDAVAYGRPVINTPVLKTRDKFHFMPRDHTWEVHTPQLFKTELLRSVLKDPASQMHPDEWSFMATSKETRQFCTLCTGNSRTAFKLTYPDDVDRIQQDFDFNITQREL